MTPAAFRRDHPELFFLDLSDGPGVARYLEKVGLLRPTEAIREVQKAGEGNMNCTARITTTRRSLVLKQSRPWVEKYPQFEAPWDRAVREAEFYRLISGIPKLASFMPRLLFSSSSERILILEDLGPGGDFSGIYRGESLADSDVIQFAEYLSWLHGAFTGAENHPELPNREMRALNHRHIFDIPLRPQNGLDLNRIMPGLQDCADKLKASPDFCREVARLGVTVYLADGPCLVHGDFFPGSLIRTPLGPRVVDPEFCCFGHAEYDVSVLLAHLFLGCQRFELWRLFANRYVAPPGFIERTAYQLAGVEIMRRLIGYAQLPLAWGLETRRALLDLAHDLVVQPERTMAEPPVIHEAI